MEALAQTKKIGGSIMVTIPKEIIREEAIQEGEMVIIEIKKPKKSFFGSLKGMSSFTKEDEFKGQLEE